MSSGFATRKVTRSVPKKGSGGSGLSPGSRDAGSHSGRAGEAAGVEIGLPRRRRIFQEGMPATAIFEVIEGFVIIYKTLADGRRMILEFVGKGELLGAGQRALHSCSAETLCAARIRVRQWGDIECSPDLQRRLARQLMKKVDLLREHALLLGRKTAIERIATFLLSWPSSPLDSGTGRSGSKEAMFSIALKQRDIGDYLGLNVETVSRNIAKLKRRMIIATGRRGQFRLLDKDALRLIAEVGYGKNSGFA